MWLGWETQPSWGSLARSPLGSDRLLRHSAPASKIIPFLRSRGVTALTSATVRLLHLLHGGAHSKQHLGPFSASLPHTKQTTYKFLKNRRFNGKFLPL